MAPRSSVRAPTTASLPDSLRIPSNASSLVKTLGRLSRPSLLDLALQWLDDKNVKLFPPYLESEADQEAAEDEDSPYPPARDVEELRGIYRELQDRKGGKREVIDRILDGDWRRGVTLRQLATVDMRYIEDHPAGLRWTALQLAHQELPDRRSESPKDPSSTLPQLHASTFLRNLQAEISPLVKAHYYLCRSIELPLTFLRVFVTDSPYQYPRQTSQAFTDSSRIIYAAFPDSSPYVYTSLSPSSPAAKTAGPGGFAADTRTLRSIVRDSIPKALSRPHERYILQPTSLTAKSLHALLSLRGPGRTNNANGAFSIFADAVVDGTPLDPRLPQSVASKQDPMKWRPEYSEPSLGPETLKRRVASRFGQAKSSAALDRLEVRLQDPPVLPAEDEVEDDFLDEEGPLKPPTLTLTFAGADVISGLRQLTEAGIIDPQRMPSWMTGEEGVSTAVVRGGKRQRLR